MACGSYDLVTIKIWNITNEACINNLTGHLGPVSDLVVLSDGLLASSSYDNTIQIWNSTNDKTIKIIFNFHNYFAYYKKNSQKIINTILYKKIIY